jgi:hypothetical protein
MLSKSELLNGHAINSGGYSGMRKIGILRSQVYNTSDPLSPIFQIGDQFSKFFSFFHNAADQALRSFKAGPAWET